MTDGTVFASLRRADRVWAVASIHGEAGRLRKLHADLARRIAPDDRLVYLGNILGHGPAVQEAVDAVIGRLIDPSADVRLAALAVLPEMVPKGPE